MTALAYSVYVAPPKLALSDDLPPGEDRRMWSPTASTLIYGERDAVLVDPLMTLDEARRLADWTTAHGKNVTAVFVTHAHGDHFFGAPVLLDRFPQARLLAAADVAAHAGAQWESPWFDGFWQPRFPDQISDRHVVPEPLSNGRIELEGEDLRAIELGHTDTDGTSALHVPSIGLVVAGDSVYGDVHLYLGEARGNGAQDWLHALDILAELRPAAVVAGHKRDGDPDSPDYIVRTRRYIEDFANVTEKARDHVELYETMVRTYPDRVNRGVLWNSARTALP